MPHWIKYLFNITVIARYYYDYYDYDDDSCCNVELIVLRTSSTACAHKINSYMYRHRSL